MVFVKFEENIYFFFFTLKKEIELNKRVKIVNL